MFWFGYITTFGREQCTTGLAFIHFDWFAAFVFGRVDLPEAVRFVRLVGAGFGFESVNLDVGWGISFITSCIGCAVFVISLMSLSVPLCDF